MLEIKNLTRTYKPKKGMPVQALKNVSLSFEDKGMVFVLGKSGSGKSTLLNLIGGLDFADSGEIIIDGKSSKDFKEKDYDSYRNTYIGFVFQEYNILNEFTVGENISLALELQSQKGETGRLEEILKEVDLEGYADRKPNELSGGQKQRVAIARAIIKDPKIVMADEPTGALDSETGKAIFDTLKRLSQDRLVIVVSHDREFAEEYGDRIIELADGEVISDETKGKAQGERDAEINNLESVAGDTAPSSGLKKSRLPYKRALAMGAKTLRRKRLRLAVTIILCFISFAAFGFADVVVAFDAQKVASTALYESNDNYVSFNAYFGDGDDSGARGKVQDVVGLDCSSSDLQKIRQTMGLDFQGVINANANIVFWNEELLSDGSGKEYYKNYSKGSLPASKKLFDAMGFKLYGRLPNNQEELVITKHCFDQISLAGIQGKDDDLLPDEVVDIQDFLDKNFSIVCGNSIYKIVGVVDTFADADRALLNCQPDDVYALNWTLRKYFGYGYHSLTYIYQSLYDKCVEENTLGEDSSNFGKPLSVSIRGEDQNLSAKGAASGESLKNVDKVIWLDGNGDRKELAENEIVIGVGAADFLWSPKSDIYENRTLCDYSKTFFNGKVSFKEMSLLQLRNYGKIDIAYCMEAEEISLQELEIYKDFCLANNPNRSLFDKLRSSGYKVIDLNCDPNTMTEDDWRFSYACYLSSTKSLTVDFDNIDGGYYKNVTGRKSGEELEKKYANRIFVENRIENDLISAKWTAAKDYSINFSGFSQHRNEYANVQFDDVPKIVGIYFPKEGDPDNYLINDKIYIKGLDYEQALYKYLIAPLSGTAKTKEVTELITTLQYDTSELRTFYCNNPIYFETDWLTGTYYGIKNIVIVVSAVIGLFAILLLGNYMEQSISSKKKEIGILRSVGAKKSDVFAIFVNEGVIITAIILALAIMGVGFATLGFNLLAPMSSGLSFNLKVLNFGIRQIALLLLVGFGTTAVASAIPLYKLSKKKPVDSIQDR